MTLPRHLSNLFIRHHGHFSLSFSLSHSLSRSLSLSIYIYIIYFIKYISLQTTWIKCRRPAGVITAQARSWNGSTKELYPGKLVEERKSSRKRKHAFATRSSPQLSDKHRRCCFSEPGHQHRTSQASAGLRSIALSVSPSALLRGK